MRARIFALLLLAASVASFAGEPFSLWDFEQNYDPPKYGDKPGKVEFSTEWKKDGARSLRIDPGLTTVVEQFKLRDWTKYNTLRIHFNNTAPTASALHFEVVDKHNPYHERHINDFGLPSGESVLDVDFGAGLWRGEENKPYQGKVKTPIDPVYINRISIGNYGSAPIFVDRMELLKIDPLSAVGGFAFDFGKSGSSVMRNFAGVTEKVRYDEKRGYGLLQDGARGADKPMSFPTQMLGDGLHWPGGFRVDIPTGGKYTGYIFFERGGFWDDEASGYDSCTLKVNGTAVHSHTFGPYDAYFLFQDYEVLKIDDAVHQLSMVSSGMAPFKFTAASGANVFTLDIQNEVRRLKVAGLILAPDTADGEEFLAAHLREQANVIKSTFAAQDRGRRGEGRVAPAKALQIDMLNAGETMYPRDWPRAQSIEAIPDSIAVRGETVTVHLGVYANSEQSVVAAVNALSGEKLPASKISYGRYLPQRPYGTGAVWLDINHYRPEPNFTCGPDCARSLLVEFPIPPDAPAGVRKLEIELKSGAASLKIPVSIDVIPVTLPEIPIPLGMLRNTLTVPMSAVGPERWWALQESILAEQGRAGLTATSGSTDLGLRFENGKITGDNALKFIRLAQKHGLGKACNPYGGYFDRIYGTKTDYVSFAKAIAAFEAEHKTPPLLIYAYDEPTTDDQIENVLQSTKAGTTAGLKTVGYTSSHFTNPLWVELAKNTWAPALNLHTPEDLKKLREMGCKVWVYNNGETRYGFGIHLWRQLKYGIEGRFEWIGFVTQGLAFNNLDGREPSYSSFVIHRELGEMATPNWISAREGLLDTRLRLALEKLAAPDDPTLQAWDMNGYRTDENVWTTEKLNVARKQMLDRLKQLAK